MLQNTTLGFLKNLKKNNNKPWFDEHRKTYESAKNDFEQLVQSVIDAHAKNDPAIGELQAKQCLFRINRDIRFSKDKSPYKTNFGASINADGKNSPKGGYYIHLEPGGSFAGGGIYHPMPPDLKKIRQEIDYNWEEFRRLIQGKKFSATFGPLWQEPDMKLSRVPKDFDKDSPAADFLMLKSYVAAKPIPDSALTEKSIVKTIAEAFHTIQPLLQFLNRSFD